MQHSSLRPLNWQDLRLEHDFSEPTQAVQFFDFQVKTQQALTQFALSENGTLLILKSETFPEFFADITDYLAQYHTETLVKTEFNRHSLFGYSLYLEQERHLENVEGLLQQAHQKILMLNIAPLLDDISLWDKLKQALLFGEYETVAANAIPTRLPIIHTEFKLILVGSREDISALSQYDDSLDQFSHYAEIEAYWQVLPENLHRWGSYVQTAAQRYAKKTFSNLALNQFLQHYIRESESRALISISPTLLKKHLLGLARFYPEQRIFCDIQSYFDRLAEQASTLHRYVEQDILADQLYIETEGETIGQINGLSVVEFEGVPYAFGEPIRISCNVQYGDGEIQDIERKVELGGNLHAKGIILAQSCLANLLELPTQLPFSASLAFEQSYGDIDGDSSSLAIFCVLISTLAQLPLPQSLAITGAIDQFGNVLSVGGVNQKIEGFFDICHARDLTGKQGVIIPTACLAHLSLKAELVEAVKQGQFHIWAVSDVFDALQILFGLPFYDEETADSQENTIFKRIHQQIHQNEKEETSGSFWQKICKRLKND